MNADRRARILADVAERVALLNEFRTDDFQDQVVRLVSDARESWRKDQELPARGADPMLDALLAMGDMADSSPIAVRDACAAAFAAAGDARVTR